MSEPKRAADPAPRSARIARAAARPAPGVATALLCALALVVSAAHATLGSVASRPAPAAAARILRVAKPACKPRRLRVGASSASTRRRKPARCIRV